MHSCTNSQTQFMDDSSICTLHSLPIMSVGKFINVQAPHSLMNTNPYTHYQAPQRPPTRTSSPYLAGPGVPGEEPWSVGHLVMVTAMVHERGQ